MLFFAVLNVEAVIQGGEGLLCWERTLPSLGVKMTWPDKPLFLAGPLLFNKPLTYTGTVGV